MAVDIDLKQIQRKVYMSYFQDGLWDILLGFFLIGWGLMIRFDFVAVMGGIWMAFFFIIMGLKKRLTYPRAGYIKLAEVRRQHVKMVILGVVLFVAGLGAFFMANPGVRPDWFSEYFMFMFGAMMAVVVVILGYWWKVTRWYAFAGILIIVFATYQWLTTPLELAFIVPGGIIVLYGLVLLIRFMQRYPKPSEGGIDAGR